MVMSLRRVLAYAGAAFAGFLAWIIVQILSSTVLDLYPGGELATLVYVLLTVAAVASAVWVILLMLRRRGFYSPVILTRKIKRTLLVAYFITWAFGAPAAQNEVTRFAIAEYKRMRDSRPDDVFPSHPHIVFAMTLPVAPGLLISYHEYSVAGLYGWGGWGLHVWYGLGARQIFGFPVWMS
jgi:hypothetical protein